MLSSRIALSVFFFVLFFTSVTFTGKFLMPLKCKWTCMQKMHLRFEPCGGRPGGTPKYTRKIPLQPVQISVKAGKEKKENRKNKQKYLFINKHKYAAVYSGVVPVMVFQFQLVCNSVANHFSPTFAMWHCAKPDQHYTHAHTHTQTYTHSRVHIIHHGVWPCG